MATVKARCLYEYMRASGMLCEFLEDGEFSDWKGNVSGLRGVLGFSEELVILFCWSGCRRLVFLRRGKS